jgi:hypothetical protein
MLEFSEIIERVKDIISSKKIGGRVYDKDVAAELGINQGSLATMKKRNSIPYAELMSFCARKKISINWLFFDQPVEMLIEETSKFFRVRYYADLRASAGGGADVFDENYEMISIDEKIVQKMTGSDSRKLEAIHVSGDSMEPTLQDGSIVFVDREQTDIKKEGIFIAATTAGLFIKRIRQRADGMVELISDNKTYSPEVLLSDEVKIVGKVVGNIEKL